MAKSDSNSNDLRQDQPECYICTPHSGEGLLAVNVANTLTHKWSTFDDTGRMTKRASPNYQG